MPEPKLPKAARSIEKGVPLKLVLDKPAIQQLALNISYKYKEFNKTGFKKDALQDLEPLTLKERGFKIADSLRNFLPDTYEKAIDVLLLSLTPPLTQTTDLGLAGMFYLPHICFIERYGQNRDYNGGKDPFEKSMQAQYELTKRFTAEFSIRTFLIEQPNRTFQVLYKWMHDKDPHVRRLASEGSRTRLPWAQKIQALIDDPTPSIPILEQLKNDEDLYVRRSVANHVGDLAKDNLDLALDLCESWLDGASKELKWVIRHAVRYPAKKEVPRALAIRKRAK